MIINEEIQIPELTHLADLTIRKTIGDYVEHYVEHFCANNPELDFKDGEDRHKLYEKLYEFIRDPYRKNTLINDLLTELGRTLTQMTNKYQDEKLPPRLRGKYYRRVVVNKLSTDGAGGSYDTLNKMIKVNVDYDIVFHSITECIHEEMFGESNGMDGFVTYLLAVFVHEYTHSEQWKRGLSDKVTRGYMKRGGDRRGPLYGGHMSPNMGDVGRMRYLSSAHEIESFASGAAVELTRDILSYDRYGHGKISADRVDELCQDLAYGYSHSNQLKNYKWLREYREHYIELGFDEDELETIFKRFMKTLYQKLQQFKKGLASHPSEQSWVRHVPLGMKRAIEMIAAELDNPHSDLVYRAAQFINRVFFKDEWDMQRIDKIENTIKRLIIRG